VTGDPTAIGDGPLSVRGAPKAGEELAGKYTVLEVLGTGGMGVVVAARHKALGDNVAIKLLLPKALRDKEAIGRFVREARTAAKIKSDHVARVLDIGALDTGVPFIVMELLEGQDLGRLLRSEGRQPIGEAVDWVLQACVAIAEAHALGIVHRDLKPSNLFLANRSDGTTIVKVVDFGISKALEADLGEPRDTELTDTQATFGSPAYMSPEQIRSAKNVDYRTDIWSLGVILYELLVGDTPFRGETSSGVLAAIAADPAPRLRAQRPDAPPDLEEAVALCLTKDVAQRFATVAELAVAIAPFGLESSKLHLDRILRLSTAGSGKLPAPRRSVPTSAAPPAAFAATEKPWVTSGSAHPRARLTPLTLVLLGLVAGLGAALVVTRAYLAPARTTPTPMPTPMPMQTPTPTPTASATATTTATASATATATASATATATATDAGNPLAPALRRARPVAADPTKNRATEDRQ
jgi:eukaryotic-like serine/threonine-protein kinase